MAVQSGDVDAALEEGKPSPGIPIRLWQVCTAPFSTGIRYYGLHQNSLLRSPLELSPLEIATTLYTRNRYDGLH